MTFTDYVFEFSSGLEKIAIIDKKRTTYKQVYFDMNSIAKLLVSKGLTKKDSVLILSENSSFFIKNYFGIIKSGCICVPLNPATSVDDVIYITDILKIKYVFIQDKLVKKFNRVFSDQLTIYTETDLRDLVYNCELKVDTDIDMKNDIALIMFTSGSTAKPKGVMLTHYNLMFNTNSIIKYLKLTKEDRIETVLPFYYCFGTSLLNTHFRCGGSIVINNKFMFPETVLDDINKYDCTGFAGVPSTYQILLRMTDIKVRKLPSLRYITQAGGKLPDVFILELQCCLKNIDIFIMYGQTEATARLSYLPPKLINKKPGSIGKGIPGTQLMVLDKYGVNVKPGEIGEVVARGGNVMKGYFNDKEETQKVLKGDLLFTGDLATIDEDDYIYIVSREKNIIKSGGNRVSPKEIENVIVQIEEVVECAVIGVLDDILGEAVKAFVVLKEIDSIIDDRFIIKYCRDRLPSFKTPKYVEFMSALPKNSSGKILLNVLKSVKEKLGEKDEK